MVGCHRSQLLADLVRGLPHGHLAGTGLVPAGDKTGEGATVVSQGLVGLAQRFLLAAVELAGKAVHVGEQLGHVRFPLVAGATATFVGKVQLAVAQDLELVAQHRGLPQQGQTLLAGRLALLSEGILRVQLVE
ncbi:hypothetical protein D9M68_750630 [compost metagenome]